MTRPLAAAVWIGEPTNEESNTRGPRTDDVQSRALQTKGVCKDINVSIDDGLRPEKRGIFVIYVSAEYEER